MLLILYNQILSTDRRRILWGVNIGSCAIGINVSGHTGQLHDYYSTTTRQGASQWLTSKPTLTRYQTSIRIAWVHCDMLDGGNKWIYGYSVHIYRYIDSNYTYIDNWTLQSNNQPDTLNMPWIWHDVWELDEVPNNRLPVTFCIPFHKSTAVNHREPTDGSQVSCSVSAQ